MMIMTMLELEDYEHVIMPSCEVALSWSSKSFP